MRINKIVQINLKKLKKHRVSARFLILPIALLVALVILISSQVTNFRAAARSSIFGTVEEQNKLIELRQRPQPQQGGQRGSFNIEDLYYTQDDINTINSIKNVQKTQTLFSVPINNMSASNLFGETNFSVRQLMGLDADFAALYTDQNFSYKAGEPIPIILNANDFVEAYQDWGGKDEIIIDMMSMRENREAIRDAFPIKSKAIDYDKDALIGKEITVRFGGLEGIQDYDMERGESGLVFKKLADTEIETRVNARKDEISKYWDYDKISMALEYKFKVVGVIEDESDSSSFVPQDFINQLMQGYIKNQLDARNDAEMSKDLLGATFTGLQYDGVELGSGINAFGFRGGPGGGGATVVMGREATQSGYRIPGLVIQVDREDTSNVIGEYKDANVYESSVKNSDTVLIKINDIADREQVIDDLNEAGYAYQDLSKSEVFFELESTLNMVSRTSVAAFIGLSIIIIIFTMGKFIAESKREIGILRAVGATKPDIKKIFIVQASLYTLVGYIIGAIGSVVLNFAFASPIKAWFDSFVDKTVKESFGVVNPVSTGVFLNIDLHSLAIYSLILLVVTVLVSIIPANKASNISPVEAIRSSE